MVYWTQIQELSLLRASHRFCSTGVRLTDIIADFQSIGTAGEYTRRRSMLFTDIRVSSFCTGNGGLLSDLMTKSSIRGNLTIYTPDISATHAKGLDYILGETNSYACHVGCLATDRVCSRPQLPVS